MPPHWTGVSVSSSRKYDPKAVPRTRHGRNADTIGLGRYRMPIELRGKQRAVFTNDAQKRGSAIADHSVLWISDGSEMRDVTVGKNNIRVPRAFR